MESSVEVLVKVRVRGVESLRRVYQLESLKGLRIPKTQPNIYRLSVSVIYQYLEMIKSMIL
jgi:hypothetical protein